MLLEFGGVSKRHHLRGSCGEEFDLKSDLLLTFINTFQCFYLIEIFDNLPLIFSAIGAGEGIRTLDPNLGKVVLYH